MAAPIEFAILGPLEARAGKRRINLGGDRQRRLLAALILRAGGMVAMPDLITAAWDDDPPLTARRQVHNGVWQLRQALGRHGRAGLLHSEPAGYRLAIHPEQLDLHRFESGVAEGRRLASARQTAAAARTLRTAVSLWRGPALAGLTGGHLEREAARLDELRLLALEDCVEYELRTGRSDMLAEVASLVAEHPLRERLAAALMLGLYRTGRQAEALAAYQRTAAALASELGIDPSAELRRRYEAILRNDPALSPGPTVSAGDRADRVPPAELPPTGLFVGRGAYLEKLDALLTDRGSVVIAAIEGTAGVGKTGLALHWAHRVADRFPDGQLYVNLRGFDPTAEAMSPAEAVRGFLAALAVPLDQVPAEPRAQFGLYRSLLAGRRVLVVLDNARDADHVRPLLPGSPGCFAVVTSRRQLAGLIVTEGAHPISLDLLGDDEARDLLAHRLGRTRVDAEPGAIDTIVAQCAGLPLALAIVAARAARHPTFPLASLAAELHARHGSLEAFSGGEVRAVFSWSYRTLNPGAARLFRLSAGHPGPELTVATAAALLGEAAEAVRPLLAELADAHLLTEPRPDRFASHDLLRAYAAELSGALDDAAEREAAAQRVRDHYMRLAHAAARLVTPNRPPVPLPGPARPDPFDTEAAALAWFDDEHQALLALARAGFAAPAFAWAIETYFDRQGHWAELAVLNRALLAGVRGDDAAAARAHRGLALAYTRLGQYDEAHDHHQYALGLFAALDDRTGQAQAHRGLGWVLEQQQRYEEALAHALRALDLSRREGDRYGEARALNAAGWDYAQLGDYRRALHRCRQALSLLREVGGQHDEASVWDSLGYIHHRRGDHREAIGCYEHALELTRTLADRYNEANVSRHLGEAYAALGDPAAARAAWVSAASILDSLGHPDAAQVYENLAQ